MVRLCGICLSGVLLLAVLLLAGSADSEYGDSPGLRLKAVLLAGLADMAGEFFIHEFDKTSAFGANHVFMLGVSIDMFKVGVGVVVADFSHQIGLQHQSQSAINRASADAIDSLGEI